MTESRKYATETGSSPAFLAITRTTLALFLTVVAVYGGYWIYLSRFSLRPMDNTENEIFLALGQAVVALELGSQERIKAVPNAVSGPEMCRFWTFEAIRTRCRGLAMPSPRRVFWIVLTLLIAVGALVLVSSFTTAEAARPPDQTAAPGDIIVISWNDLGMHCYNRDFNDVAVLPPANTLWAQVVKIGNPPQIITAGVTVEYFFADNTNSTSKSNFWSTNPYTSVQNAQKLFGLLLPLPANIGLAGKGLSAQMDRKADHFMAEWIPLNEFSDSHRVPTLGVGRPEEVVEKRSIGYRGSSSAPRRAPQGDEDEGKTPSRLIC